MGTPSVTIGSRQNGRERADNVIDVDYNSSEIIEAVKTQIKRGKYPQNYLYGRGDAGEKIANLLSNVDIYCQKRIKY